MGDFCTVQVTAALTVLLAFNRQAEGGFWILCDKQKILVFIFLSSFHHVFFFHLKDRSHKFELYCSPMINALPDDKILALSKLKAFTDNRSYATQNIKFIFHNTENIVGKGEKCWLPAFFPYPTMFFKKAYSLKKKKNVENHQSDKGLNIRTTER